LETAAFEPESEPAVDEQDEAFELTDMVAAPTDDEQQASELPELPPETVVADIDPPVHFSW
jgi:hypothetical protein